jgi:hypothetical protein
MIVERITIADVAAQGTNVTVPRNFHHLEYRGAVFRRAGQKTGTQAVPAVERRLEPFFSDNPVIAKLRVRKSDLNAATSATPQRATGL